MSSDEHITVRDWRRRPQLRLRATKKLDIHWCCIKCNRCPRMRAVAYAGSLGSFNKTYGSLGAVIGFMMWIWISAIVVLLSAELDAGMEHQTARDRTEGAPRPLGKRGAGS